MINRTGAMAILKGVTAILAYTSVSKPGRTALLVISCPHRFTPCDLSGDLVAGEEGLNTILDPTVGLGTIDCAFAAVIVGRLEEKEDNNDGECTESYGPPVFHRPIGLRGNKASKSRTCRRTKVQSQVENSESSATLVQEEHVHEVFWAEDADSNAKESGKVPRDKVWRILIVLRHHRCPDLCRENPEEGPEDDRCSSELVRERPPKVATGSKASGCSGVLWW